MLLRKMLRADALTCVTGWPSRYSRIEMSCGARSQITPSGWYLPRFIRDDVTKYTSPSESWRIRS